MPGKYSLYDRMMVGPGRLETVRQLFDRLNTAAIPHQKTNDRRCHTADQPNYILHFAPHLVVTTNVVSGWMQER